MLHTQRLLISLGVVALLLLTISAAAAKSDSAAQPQPGTTERTTPRPNEPPRITWAPGQLVRALKAGQTVQVSTSFVSSAALSNVSLRVSGDLGKVMKANPVTFATIPAGRSTTVVFIIAMPAQNARAQSGAVQLVAGQRALAEPLQAIINLVKDQAATPTRSPTPTHKPTATRKPEPTRSPTPTRKPEPTRRPTATRAPEPTSPAYPAPLPR